jgi:peptidoglycan/xylan/chitin deacetylase (PgdA/CDA1 family)
MGAITIKMNLIKRIVKSAAGISFEKLLTAVPYFNDLRLIFMYHRIVEKPPIGLHDPALFVTSETLEMHLREISKYFNIVSLDNIVAPDAEKKRLCAITFDDGWVDNYDFAFAVLKKYRVPATIFIPVNMVVSNPTFWFQNLWDLASRITNNGKSTDFIQYFSGHVPSWGRPGIGFEQIYDLTNELKRLPASKLDTIVLQAYERLGIKLPITRYIMNWDQIHEMSQHGITFGSHGLHHYILTQLNYDTKHEEVVNSFGALQNAKIAMTPFFSYPNGNWDDETLSLVKQAGYQGAVTTELGFNMPSTNPYLLKRIAIHEDISHTSSLLWFRIFQAVIS